MTVLSTVKSKAGRGRRLLLVNQTRRLSVIWTGSITSKIGASIPNTVTSKKISSWVTKTAKIEHVKG